MTDIQLIAIVWSVFLLAGSVKGLVGFGLPTISLGLLAFFLDIGTAIALMLLPSIFTNALQAVSGGHGRTIIRKIWPFLLMASLTIWIGTKLMIHVDKEILTFFLGMLLILYGISGRHNWAPEGALFENRLVSALLGGINGMITGLTGISTIPGIFYLKTLGLPPSGLVQAMGMLFLLSTSILAMWLYNNLTLTPMLTQQSFYAVIPAIAGLTLGQQVRKQMSDRSFNHLFFLMVILLGVALLGKAIIAQFTL